MARRKRTILLWSLAAALIMLVVVKFYVADVYPVESESMRPTIFGGRAPGSEETYTEWVLVEYEHAPKLDRFDLVVVKPEDGGSPLVKRVGGLPGERILVSGGDLAIEESRLPADSPRPEPIVVFDDRLLDVGLYFQFKEELWTHAGSEWQVDARAVARDSENGMMLFHKPLLDDYLDPVGQRVTGLVDVNDGIVECEVLLEPGFAADARLRLKLVEEGDTFQATIEPDGRGGFSGRITRRNPDEPFALLWQGAVPFTAGEWQRFFFANVDNHLSLEVGRSFRAQVTYEANRPLRNALGARTLGPRVGFGAEGCGARFRAVVLLRDLYYTGSGEHAVTSMLSLGPDEYFLLGDNSSRSKDSRHFGPVRAADIVGRPVAVIWPLSRFRWLR